MAGFLASAVGPHEDMVWPRASLPHSEGQLPVDCLALTVPLGPQHGAAASLREKRGQDCRKGMVCI